MNQHTSILESSPKSKDLATVPIQNDRQVNKARWHRDEGDISCPHLVRPVDFQVAQQVWINLVCRIALAGIGFWVNGLDTHDLHQSMNALVVDLVSFHASAPNLSASLAWAGGKRRIYGYPAACTDGRLKVPVLV